MRPVVDIFSGTQYSPYVSKTDRYACIHIKSVCRHIGVLRGDISVVSISFSGRIRVSLYLILIATNTLGCSKALEAGLAIASSLHLIPDIHSGFSCIHIFSWENHVRPAPITAWNLLNAEQNRATTIKWLLVFSLPNCTAAENKYGKSSKSSYIIFTDETSISRLFVLLFFAEFFLFIIHTLLYLCDDCSAHKQIDEHVLFFFILLLCWSNK